MGLRVDRPGGDQRCPDARESPPGGGRLPCGRPRACRRQRAETRAPLTRENVVVADRRAHGASALSRRLARRFVPLFVAGAVGGAAIVGVVQSGGGFVPSKVPGAISVRAASAPTPSRTANGRTGTTTSSTTPVPTSEPLTHPVTTTPLRSGSSSNGGDTNVSTVTPDRRVVVEPELESSGDRGDPTSATNFGTTTTTAGQSHGSDD